MPGSMRCVMMAGGMMGLGEMRFRCLGAAGRVLGIECGGAQGAKTEDGQDRRQLQYQNTKLHFSQFPLKFDFRAVHLPDGQHFLSVLSAIQRAASCLSRG